VILTLATVGVLLSAAVTAAGMHYLAGWGWQSAILFGVLIAATDPVSVIATFKEAGVHGRLRLLMEAESLFNDSAVAVAFSLALVFASGGASHYLAHCRHWSLLLQVESFAERWLQAACYCWQGVPMTILSKLPLQQ
jgi:NhaP-type Na+/H+ or K+/H+ antiporter